MASTLERLSLDELHAMLRFRWAVATGGGPHPFTDEAVALIFERASGVPREANILADNSLLLAFHRKQKQIDAQIVEAVATDRWQNLDRKEAA